jgi:hypothetical protein
MNRSFYAQMLKEGTMKKETTMIAILAILSFLLVTILPCQADDIYGCYPKKGGTLRIVSNLSKCKIKSEYPVTLSGTSQQNQNPIPNFEGELCWSFQVTENEEGPIAGGTYLLKSKINCMGGPYYTIQGYVAFTNEKPHLVGGYAVFLENEIIMTLTGSKDHTPDSYRDNDVFQISMNTSLNGTWWGLTKSFNTATRQFGSGIYAAGILTITTCP